MLRHRTTPVLLVALALFGINLIARVVLWATGVTSDTEMTVAGFYSMLAMVFVTGYAGFRWTRRYETVRVVGEVGGAIVLGCLLAVLVAPLIVGLNPTSGGLGIVLRQLGLCFAICVLGAFVGLLIVLAMGQDRKSRAWKYQEQRFTARPHRATKR